MHPPPPLPPPDPSAQNNFDSEPPRADDTRLEQALRDATQAYIADDGFTARVTAALPVARRRPHVDRRTRLLTAAGLCGTTLALVAGGRDIANLAQATLDNLLRWSRYTPPGFDVPLGALAIALLCLLPAAWAWHRLGTLNALRNR